MVEKGQVERMNFMGASFRMGIIQGVVTICGVIGIIIGVLVALFYWQFSGWTWTQCANYLFRSTKEEKMVLTKPGNYNSNGCMVRATFFQSIAGKYNNRVGGCVYEIIHLK